MFGMQCTSVSRSLLYFFFVYFLFFLQLGEEKIDIEQTNKERATFAASPEEKKNR